MITMQPQNKPATNGRPASLDVTVRDVTGTHVARMDLDPQMRVGAVADAVASRLALATDTAWSLREASTAAFLDDEKSIGDALGPGQRTSVALVATPRAHLG